MGISYLWSKFIKKLPSVAIKNTQLERPVKIEARSTVIDSSIGRYSYCGYGCTILDAEIGRFCSISDNVIIGQASHPMKWVSTSPAFYRGKDSIPKDLASLEYNSAPAKTIIGNDVWIGQRAMLRAGITVGDGAVIAMGAIVVKNVEPYTIVGGNPARMIRKRFSDDIIRRLTVVKWWNCELKDIKQYSALFDNPAGFLEKMEKCNK